MEQMYCERFWKYREQFHLTQEELAERIGVSRQTVSKWERGESSPDTENLLKLSKLYGVSIDDLLHRDPNPSVGGAQSANSTGGAAPENGETAENGNGTNESASGDENERNGDSPGGGNKTSGNAINASASENGEAASGAAAEHTEAQTAKEESTTANESAHERAGAENRTEAQAAEEEPTTADKETHEHTGAKSLTGVVAGVAAVGATAVYLFLGCCLHLWHPGWLVFFLIPICALIAEAIDGKENGRIRWEDLTGMVAVGVTAAYLFLGCCLHLWHPGWLVFFLIPAWAIIAEAIDRSE